MSHEKSYPFGVDNWNITYAQPTALSFDSCNHDQFNCANGECIPEVERYVHWILILYWDSLFIIFYYFSLNNIVGWRRKTEH